MNKIWDDKRMETDRKFHYCVLYTQAVKQTMLKKALKEALPRDRGFVFCPGMECWRRGSGKSEIKALFPGYIFIRSDMDACELHEFVKENQRKLGTFVRELGLSEKRASGDNVFGSGGKENGSEGRYMVTDLKEEEAEFMDFLLGADDMESVKDGGGSDPGEGLLKMSYGYSEKGKYIVMEGPLKAYENRIADVNKHDRKAFLDFAVNGYVVRAGFELKPRRHWFPEEKGVPEVLSDGTEVDLRELKKKMMGG